MEFLINPKLLAKCYNPGFQANEDRPPHE